MIRLRWERCGGEGVFIWFEKVWKTVSCMIIHVVLVISGYNVNVSDVMPDRQRNPRQ